MPRSIHPHLNPLPSRERKQAPFPWIPAAYRGAGRALTGKTKWGRRVDVGVGIAVGVRSRDVSAWIPAFAGMTKWVAGMTKWVAGMTKWAAGMTN